MHPSASPPPKIRVRDNTDLTAKCRCGRLFTKEAIFTGGRSLPYFCPVCDRPR